MSYLAKQITREIAQHKASLAAAKAGRKPLAWWVAVCESEVRRCERDLATALAGGVPCGC